MANAACRPQTHLRCCCRKGSPLPTLLGLHSIHVLWHRVSLPTHPPLPLRRRPDRADHEVIPAGAARGVGGGGGGAAGRSGAQQAGDTCLETCAMWGRGMERHLVHRGGRIAQTGTQRGRGQGIAREGAAWSCPLFAHPPPGPALPDPASCRRPLPVAAATRTPTTATCPPIPTWVRLVFHLSRLVGVLHTRRVACPWPRRSSCAPPAPPACPQSLCLRAAGPGPAPLASLPSTLRVTPAASRFSVLSAQQC